MKKVINRKSVSLALVMLATAHVVHLQFVEVSHLKWLTVGWSLACAMTAIVYDLFVDAHSTKAIYKVCVRAMLWVTLTYMLFATTQPGSIQKLAFFTFLWIDLLISWSQLYAEKHSKTVTQSVDE